MQRVFANLFRTIGAASVGALVISAALAPQAASADPEKRVALVIGNGGYTAAPPLSNTSADARAVAAALKRLGFQVIEGYDLSVAQMRQSVATFSAALPDTKAAIVYYAGHGLSVADENWILPTDIVLRSPADLDLGAMSVSALLKTVQGGERKSAVIVDACRDNPFAAELAHSKSDTVVSERGLGHAAHDLPPGTMVAFASDPDGPVLDCNAARSPFARALLHHLEDRGVPFDAVMSRVSAEVRDATRNKQSPLVTSALAGELSLNPEPTPAKLARATPKAIEVASVGDAPAPAAATVAPTDPQTADIGLGKPVAPAAAIVASAQAQTADVNAGKTPEPSAVIASPTQTPATLASLGKPPAQPAATVTLAAPQAAVIAHPTDAPTPSAAAVASAAGSVEVSAATSPEALKAEIGTEETENSLNLGFAERQELQQRLATLDFEVGPADGVFGDMTRSAIADWQDGHGLKVTGWLGPQQLAALRVESGASYRHVAQPADDAPRYAEPSAYRAPAYGRDNVPYSRRQNVDSPDCND